MIFEQVPVGRDRNFAYLVGDEGTRRAAVVDPAYRPDAVLAQARDRGLEVVYLINTHAHFDHVSGNDEVRKRTGARLLAGDARGSADGLRVALGAVTLTLIHTPGHTPDSICVLAEAPGETGRLITGDTLFVGKVGGTNTEEGARAEYDSLHRRLLILPEETEVWPGHDFGVSPWSTIGHEKRTNPFLLRPTFEEFFELKRSWLAYKKAHGIQ